MIQNQGNNSEVFNPVAREFGLALFYSGSLQYGIVNLAFHVIMCPRQPKTSNKLGDEMRSASQSGYLGIWIPPEVTTPLRLLYRYMSPVSIPAGPSLSPEHDPQYWAAWRLFALVVRAPGPDMYHGAVSSTWYTVPTAGTELHVFHHYVCMYVHQHEPLLWSFVPITTRRPCEDLITSAASITPYRIARAGGSGRPESYLFRAWVHT